MIGSLVQKFNFIRDTTRGRLLPVAGVGPFLWFAELILQVLKGLVTGNGISKSHVTIYKRITCGIRWKPRHVRDRGHFSYVSF